ncbi:MAG: HAD family hydrolase [Bacteroidota bacterium]|nr:HAD family hydrolase [Bacteroidota bacterium]
MKKIIVTDLDGTLFNSKTEISLTDIETLRLLGKKDIIRVIATGRSMFSAINSLPIDFPIEYIISSSGAAIFDWKTKELLKSFSINKNDSLKVFEALVKRKVDFSIQMPVPENHNYFFVKSTTNNPDFERRNNLYKSYAKEIKKSYFETQETCQFIAIVNGNKSLDVFNEIKRELKILKVIRSTSPIDGKSLWIEIYHSGVSKANGIKFIANLHKIEKENILTIGNDYNDLDMLRWSKNSFVVSNSPKEIKDEFQLVSSNDESGFSAAVNQWLLLN